VSQSKLLSVDFAVSATIPLLGVWLYEISNFTVLAAQGYSVTISMSGWIPIGVAGASTGVLSPLTKIFQIAISVGLLIPLWTFFSKTRLIVAETLVITTASIYLASAYWEMLSTLASVPLPVHTGMFIAGTTAIALLMLRMFDRPRLFSKRVTSCTPRALVRRAQ
jgi:hypothetical protein